MWIFGSGNINDTQPGATDADSGEVVIATGYSSRKLVEKTQSVTRTVKAYQITPSHGHTYGAWTKVDGNTHKQSCACGDTRTASHNWDGGKITAKATCSQEGVKTYTCQTCGGAKTEKISKLSHTYSNACDTTCNGCGQTRSVSHSYASQWISDRNQHWHKCSVCGAAGSKSNHSESEWIMDKEAQEFRAGSKHTQCTVCQRILQTVSIPATGCKHTGGTKLVGEKTASCEEEGYTGDSVCDLCSTVLEVGKWTPKIEHEVVRKDVADATCELPGYTGDEVCVSCGTMVKKEM